MSVDDIDIHFGSHADVRAVADCPWLDSALRARGLDIVEGSERRLTGGCHSIVIHGAFPQGDLGDAVVKWISGDASVMERTWLRLMLGLDYYRDKRVQLLRSFVVEASFYRDFSGELAGLRVPLAHYVHSDPWRQRFATVLEAVPAGSLDAGEPGGFSAESAGACLRRLAGFHASWWSRPVPRGADIWERGGFWLGANRRGSKRRFPDCWSDAISGLGLDPAHAGLGQGLAPQLDRVFAKLDAIPNRTLIHGDFKVTNVFVDPGAEHPDEEVWAIDWQWFGRGSPVADSVYFLLTSVRADLLRKDMVEALVRKHHNTLLRNGVTDYSFEEMWSEWRWVAIDFLLYVVTCKWYRMTRTDVSTYAAQGHDGFHLRSMEHMESIIRLVREFLVDLDLLAEAPDRDHCTRS